VGRALACAAHRERGSMHSTEPVISVVVPTHHRTRQLRLLLESLVAQTLGTSRFEVIVVGDEGDPGELVVREFSASDKLDVRFTFVVNDPWSGRSPSLKRNYGASLARSEWLALIDDDCVAHANWLTAALKFFDSPKNGAVEGSKIIPPIDPPTLTYRGLLLFTKPGGYQTANMFYRRSVFLEVGGFDLAFPFYLEDTDLAWSVLDRGFDIPHAHEAVVSHPVSPPEPMRLLANAQRSILVPYLYRKHVQRFRSSGMRATPRAHVPYLALYLVLVIAIGSAKYELAVGVLPMLTLLTLAHTWKLFRGCFFTVSEILTTAALLPVVPVVAFVQLNRGNLRHRTWLWR
jgi:GT2 family glycosyltransferase